MFGSIDPSARTPAAPGDTIPAPPPAMDPDSTLESMPISTTEIALHADELDEE